MQLKDISVLVTGGGSGLGLLVRGRDYALLDRPEVQAVLACPPIGVSTHPESGMVRSLSIASIFTSPLMGRLCV